MINKPSPIIAIIVSNKMKFCKDFLGFHQLNPKMFKCASDLNHLRCTKKDTPIIITHHSMETIQERHEWRELLEFIQYRFTNIRFIDY